MTTLNSIFSDNWYDMAGYSDSNEYKKIPAEWKPKVDQFIEDGYTILQGAIPENLIDSYVETIYESTLRRKAMLSRGADNFRINSLDELNIPLTKLLDTHAFSSASLSLIFSKQISKFIDYIWGTKPFCFQTLHFEKGSTQAIHQDTAYVVINKPLDLCAAWIALEDVIPGSGELVYYPKSHRFPDFLYNDQKVKNWDPAIDGHQIHNHHLYWINEEAKKLQLQTESFFPKKGDVLIWHADLAHGGGKILDSHLTRRSLVAHYTKPKNTPHYFHGLPKTSRCKIEVNGGVISSYYYPLTEGTFPYSNHKFY